MHNGRYNFIKQLPSGGFGNVCVLFDKRTGREVVVKSLITPNCDNRERFRREASILFALRDHEHVVDILEANLSLANPTITLEHCKHGTLQDWITNRGLFAPSEMKVGYAVQHAALGLHAIHRLNGFHRDVKPANLFIGENNTGQLTIKLGDFGFGRLPNPQGLSHLTRRAGGTDGYIAPELYRSYAVFTTACDIYSLGITGIELLTGSRDADSLNRAWIFNGELKKLLAEMVSKDPKTRPTAWQVADRIRFVEKKANENTNLFLLGGIALLGGLWLASKHK